jgi:LuxR family maltose regulon positive regulatory protein
VRRPRLVDGLPTDDADLPRLVLVCAPAGFGKTTLLTQWLDGWRTADSDRPRHVVWLALDAADDDPRRLVADIVAATTTTVPDVGGEAVQLLGSDGWAAPDLVLGSLLADLDDVDGSVVLAFDDYHVVESADAHAGVAFLLQHLPQHVGLAMTTRADPPLPLARLRARGELVEVRAGDLRFSAAEAAAFLNDVMGLSLEDRQVEALQGRTEGWAAGLQLAGLSLRDRPDLDDFIERFTGSHRFVLDYLVEEVLDALDDAERAFLLDTCVLDRLTGPLCDALTGREDGQTRLEALERANLFVVPLDHTRTWYRYHHLFADALRARLVAAEPERMRRLHRAAATWFAAQGRPEAAIEHAVHGHDHGLAARLVERALPEASRKRQDRTMRHWLGLLPDDEIRASPLLQVLAAWTRLVAGDVDDAERRLHVAEETLGALSVVTREADDELRQLPMTIAMYRAAIAQAHQNAEETARQARRILDLAGPQDHLRRGAGHGFLGMSLWADGELPAAVDTFTECARSMRAAGNLTDELGCAVPLALMWWGRGRPDEALRLQEAALAQALARPAVGLAVTADLHVGLAACLVERGDLDAADDHLTTARDLGDVASLPENRHRWFLISARRQQARGDLDGAAALLEQAEARYLPGFFPDLRPIRALRARVDLARGRLDLARDWARRTGVRDLDLTYRSECDHLTFARLLLAEGAAAEASALLARLHTATDGPARDGSVVEMLLLDALALKASGDDEQAVDRLTRAAALAVPAGYARIFLDEGPAMTDLLDEVRRRGGSVALPAAPDGTPADRGTGTETPALLPDQALSDRELEVLRLLATELTGPEVAGRLFVSVNTLRTHTRHIFTKLDVTTRAAAVRRGRELRLL